MVKAVWSASQPDCRDVEQHVQLTFPVLFELAAAGDPRADRVVAGQPAAARSDAMREMMAWSPWTTKPPLRSAARGPTGHRRGSGDDDQWQVRVEMTLDDAEALVEGLCSLIALAKENAAAQPAAPPPMLAFAGTKIGADDQAAPPRFSSAQLEMLSRQSVKRRLADAPNGRLVHQLFASARMEKRLPA